MATYFNLLAWKVPWTEEPGGLQSMGSQKSFTQLKTKQQQLIYNVVLIFTVQQGDSIIHMYTFLLYVLFLCSLFLEAGYSSLCCTVGPCCFSMLRTAVCIYLQPPNPSSQAPLWLTTGLFSTSVSLSHRYARLCHVLDSVCKRCLHAC